MPAANWSSYPFKQIWNQTYKHQTVVLDGCDYIKCVFDNVTFEYNGTAPTSVRESTIIHQPGHPIGIAAKNSVVAQALTVAAMSHQALGGTAEIGIQRR
jgi:hypothetical protein